MNQVKFETCKTRNRTFKCCNTWYEKGQVDWNRTFSIRYDVSLIVAEGVTCSKKSRANQIIPRRPFGKPINIAFLPVCAPIIDTKKEKSKFI